MTRPDDDPVPDGPPAIPDIRRRFHRRHLVGLALLAILPLIAAFGLLSTGIQVARESTPAFDVVVEYPSRVRATHRASLRVVASARAGHVVDGLGVSIAPDYLANFAVHDATPDRTAPGEVELPVLGPGDVASVLVDLEAVRFGLHRGTVRVGAPDGDTLAIAIRTFILP